MLSLLWAKLIMTGVYLCPTVYPVFPNIVSEMLFLEKDLKSFHLPLSLNFQLVWDRSRETEKTLGDMTWPTKQSQNCQRWKIVLHKHDRWKLMSYSEDPTHILTLISVQPQKDDLASWIQSTCIMYFNVCLFIYSSTTSVYVVVWMLVSKVNYLSI